jgi:hypothetical protein
MRKVLNDSELEAQFQKDGYISVPFISEKEVEELKQLFFDTLPESGGQIRPEDTGLEANFEINYDFTFIDKNPEYKKKVYDIISAYFKPHMERLLSNYKPIIANYIRKKHDTGEVPLHQNWSFADEKKCCTVSIWCPLVDSTVENGTLQVVPGSNKRFGEVRGPMIPWELENIKDEIIQKYLVPLETKAGDCVILDDSIVHYSAVNHSNELRLAIQLICIPTEMPALHQNMESDLNPNLVEVLEVEQDFYMEFNPWKKPDKNKIVNRFQFELRPLTEVEFSKRLYAKRYDEQPSFSQRILSKMGLVK